MPPNLFGGGEDGVYEANSETNMAKIGNRCVNRRIEEGMGKYFDAYRKKYPNKSGKNAIKATRNWVVGYIKAFGGDPDESSIAEKIERKLNELRLKDC